MPMCSPTCDCRYCKITAMAYHHQFKNKIDELLIEFQPIFAEMQSKLKNTNLLCDDDY